MFISCLKYFFNYKGDQLVVPYGFELDDIVSMEQYVHAEPEEIKKFDSVEKIAEYTNSDIEKTILFFNSGPTAIVGVSWKELFELKRNGDLLNDKYHDFIEG